MAKVDNVDQILVYGMVGILLVGAIGMVLNVGKKEEPGLVEEKQAMTGKSCGCGA